MAKRVCDSGAQLHGPCNLVCRCPQAPESYVSCGAAAETIILLAACSSNQIAVADRRAYVQLLRSSMPAELRVKGLQHEHQGKGRPHSSSALPDVCGPFPRFYCRRLHGAASQ